MAALEVEDAEAAHSEAEVAVRQNSAFIWTAMEDGGGLRLQICGADRLAAPPVPTGNPAHRTVNLTLSDAVIRGAHRCLGKGRQRERLPSGHADRQWTDGQA